MVSLLKNVKVEDDFTPVDQDEASNNMYDLGQHEIYADCIKDLHDDIIQDAVNIKNLLENENQEVPEVVSGVINNYNEELPRPEEVDEETLFNSEASLEAHSRMLCGVSRNEFRMHTSLESYCKDNNKVDRLMSSFVAKQALFNKSMEAFIGRGQSVYDGIYNSFSTLKQEYSKWSAKGEKIVKKTPPAGEIKKGLHVRARTLTLAKTDLELSATSNFNNIGGNKKSKLISLKEALGDLKYKRIYYVGSTGIDGLLNLSKTQSNQDNIWIDPSDIYPIVCIPSGSTMSINMMEKVPLHGNSIPSIFIEHDSEENQNKVGHIRVVSCLDLEDFNRKASVAHKKISKLIHVAVEFDLKDLEIGGPYFKSFKDVYDGIMKIQSFYKNHRGRMKSGHFKADSTRFTNSILDATNMVRVLGGGIGSIFTAGGMVSDFLNNSKVFNLIYRQTYRTWSDAYYAQEELYASIDKDD